MVRVALPLTFEAPDGLFQYAEYERGDPYAFIGTYGAAMLDGKSDLSAEWDHPDAIVTYGLGIPVREWLEANGMAFRTERTDGGDPDAIMFIHLPDEESAKRFTERFLT